MKFGVLKIGQRSFTSLAMLILLFWTSPLSADNWTGIDGSVDNINNLMAQATSAVQSGSYVQAKEQLAATARNLERASSWAYYIWDERKSNPTYTPISLNPLPDELKVSYYQDRMDDSRAQYKQLLGEIDEARLQLGLKKLQTLFSILTGMVNLSKGIVDTVKDNPLMAPKNLIDLQAQVEEDAANIQVNFTRLEASGQLLNRLITLKNNVVKLFRELRTIRQGINVLVPEVERIEAAMPMALDSIQRGLSMPLPPAQQATFDGSPYSIELAVVEDGLDGAELPWESGETIISELYAEAQAAYNALTPTADDTQAWNDFNDWYDAWEESLTPPRENNIQQLNVLGEEWRQELISILTDYMAISYGSPVALSDCSSHDPIPEELELTWTDPRAWKTEYQTALAAATGPAVAPSQTGALAADWHEVVIDYPSRLSSLVATYSKASQAARASMSYREWEDLLSTTDPRQPYQVFVLPRQSQNIMLENLNAIRSEANRFAGAAASAQSEIESLAWNLSVLQGKADAYRQFMENHADTVPTVEFDEKFTVSDADVTGLSARVYLAEDGISILETEAIIQYFEREVEQFAFEADEAGDQATEIGNQADALAFSINRMLAFNDAIAGKQAAAQEMLDYKFGDDDVFLGAGDYGYLFDSLEILDNYMWQHVDTVYYHSNPPDVETQIAPHVDYIQSLGQTAWRRFAQLTEEIWSVTDNLTFAHHELRPPLYNVGHGFNAGESFVILPENQPLVDEFTSVRFLKYHSRPYLEPFGYLTLEQIRQGIPNAADWVAAKLAGGYGELVIQRVSPSSYTIPVGRTIATPLVVRVTDSEGAPVAGAPISQDYDQAILQGEVVRSSDAQGLASFHPGPYNQTGTQTVTFSVAGEYTLTVTVYVMEDTDGDGCGDDWETFYGLDPDQDFDGAGDNDGDGLTNAQEQAVGSSPLSADTDEDGFTDLEEVEAGTDPADPADYPRDAPPESPSPPPMQLGVDWEKMADDLGDAAETDDWYYFTHAISFRNRIVALARYETEEVSGAVKAVHEAWTSKNGLQWTREASQPLWAPRTAFSLAVHNDRLWLAGGWTEDPENPGLVTARHADVWVSDNGLYWSRATDNAPFGQRRNGRLLSMGGKLWLVGGYVYNEQTGAYEAKNDVWSSSDGISWTQAMASAPWPLRYPTGMSAAVFEDKLWIMGGDLYDSQSGWTTYRDVWSSPDGANWTLETDAPAWDARYGAGLASLDGRLWLLGGTSHVDPYKSFEAWTSEDGVTWRSVEAPSKVRGQIFTHDHSLWSLVHTSGAASIIKHTLWRSRGPGVTSCTSGALQTKSPSASFAAGAEHALAITPDGGLWAWGANSAGQLGDGSTENRAKPVRIGEDSDWHVVAAGNYFSMAIKTDGSLWAWGQNYYGQLGVGDAENRQAPVRVGARADWASIGAGSNHVLAVNTDGTLWAWGQNNGGQLGLGSKENQAAPVQVGTDNDWLWAASGSTHGAALKTDGSVWTWGNNYYGQLGTTTAQEALTPSQGTEYEWKALTYGHQFIDAGNTTNASLTPGGALYLWGDNYSGQIGDGETSLKRWSATQIAPYDIWLAASCGSASTAAIGGDNSLWSWGSLSYFQPSGIEYAPENIPVPVGEDKDWIAVDAGANFCIAQKSDGSLWSWGTNQCGQLGTGTKTAEYEPAPVLALGPTESDADGDWMDDSWEILYFGGTPRDGEGDYDNDGLNDFLEFRIGTRPDSQDSDGDGMPDKWERDSGFDPAVDDALLDADKDGLSNLKEYLMVESRISLDGGIEAMAVSEDYLYLIDGIEGALMVFNTADPENPVPAGSYDGDFQSIYDISVNGDLACVANGDGVFHFIDVSDPHNPQGAGTYASGEGGIQGFDIGESVLAFADSPGNLQVVDISDPAAPVHKGTYDNEGVGGLGSVIVSGSRVYTTLWGSAVHIIDVSNPAAPLKIGEVVVELIWPPSMDVSGNLLYLGVRDGADGVLKAFDVSTPAAPQVVGGFPGFVEGLAMETPLASVLIDNNVNILDMGDPAAPEWLADIDEVSDSRIGEIEMSGDLVFALCGFGTEAHVAVLNISQFTRRNAAAAPGDIDHSNSVDLADAVIALQIASGNVPGEPVFADADVNNDNRIGTEEACFALQKAAGL